MNRLMMRSFLLLAAFASSAALAQFPNKPIRIVVPFPAGGSTDIAARAITQPMAQALGQPILIDNKPGADGLVAAEAVLRAPADGYTLLFATATAMSYAPVARKSIPYDPIADFTPIGRIGTFGFFLYANEELPARSVSELIAHARANPGRLIYGSSSAASIMAAAQFAQAQKLYMAHLPYAGDAPLIGDIVGGRVHVMFAAGTALPQVKTGKLKALATMLPNRSPLLPHVPTLREAGVPPISVIPWAGLFGPAKLPRDVVDRIGRELTASLARPDVREDLGRLAFEGQSSSPEELQAFVREQLAVWRQAVAESNEAEWPLP